ncbi:MAG: histidinol-phosphate transaminase [Methanothrix sp.]|nr:histidinol-phosphate transaminase [Methanothrix sp.]MDD4446121.1 histidinol-phosphate transaminase [Methanothrix sp.]
MESHSDSWRQARLRPALSQLKPYVAGKGFGEISRRYGIAQETIVKLGSNENPYGPSPKVSEAIAGISPERYPEPEELIAGIADYTGFPEEMIIIGAGMDGVMDTLTRLFLEKGDRTFIPIPTFSYYEILTITAGATPLLAPRDPHFEIAGKIPADIKMAFLCSPNNPTGNVIGKEEVCSLLESTEAIVFLDEAYVEFADRSLLGLVEQYDNLIVGRTLSKAFGLAGMRLGYAVAPRWIADQYRRAAPPFYGISCATVAAGTAALCDLPFMRRTVEMIRSERQRLQKATGAHPSQANFLYLETECDSREYVERFLARGIIIRDCRSFGGAGEHHARVTVGTPSENDRFLSAFQEIC